MDFDRPNVASFIDIVYGNSMTEFPLVTGGGG